MLISDDLQAEFEAARSGYEPGRGLTFPLVACWLGFAPRRSAAAARDVKHFDIFLRAKFGRRLPASMAGWLSFEDAHELLKRHSNCDNAIALSDMIDDEDQLSNGRLVFQIENQGVCRWAVALPLADAAEANTIDDSPVLMSDGDRWVPCAASLDHYIAASAFDWPTGGVSVCGFEAITLAFMRARTAFAEILPPTIILGSALGRRFEANGVRVTLQNLGASDFSIVWAPNRALIEELFARFGLPGDGLDFIENSR